MADLMTKPSYPSCSDRCGWNALLPPRTPRPSLTSDIEADYVVIGAGYTGLAVARRLYELEPRSRIVVLEATTIGEGASARNSGFTSHDVLPRGATLSMAHKAKLQTRIFTEAFHWLKGILDANGIKCDMKKVGAIRAAATERGEASLRQMVEVAKVNKIPHAVLSRTDIEQRIGTSYYRYGIYLRDTWLLQPALLVRGLADSLPENVELHENTPVGNMTRDHRHWRIVADEAMVRCKKVVLATNAFIPQFGYLKSRMATIYTYAAITTELTSTDVPKLGAYEAWGLLPSHRLGTTLRRIGANRLMVRSLYAHDAEIDHDDAVRQLEERFRRRWPDLAHVGFDYVWGGTTAFTMNGSPWWGELEEGVYASGGCNGSGIVKGTMLGRHLAELMLGTGNPDKVLAAMGQASWIAPEPLRTLGFSIVSAIENRRAGLEA